MFVSNGVRTNVNVPIIRYDAPAIASYVVESAAPTAGGVSLYLTGKNFGTNPTVYVGTRRDAYTCAIASHSHTDLEFTVPAGLCAGLTVYLVTLDRVATIDGFAYDPPSVTSHVTIRITGVNFAMPSNIAGLASTPLSVTLHGENCNVPPRW